MHLFRRLPRGTGLYIMVFAFMFISAQTALAAYNLDPKSNRAIIVADNILAWQTESGGWNKNIDFSTVMWEPGMVKGASNTTGIEGGTFDNDASLDEMRFLAKVYQATNLEKYKDGFMRGLDWMLKAQYATGGWPQYYPLRGGYWDLVTFNDNAMVRILTFIKELLARPSVYDFIPAEYFVRLEKAFDKGIDYIIKCQIKINGQLTAWCQQHNPFNYEPQTGRIYEHPSVTGSESVGVVKLLMSLPNPSAEIREAILGALEWFELSRLPDGRWARFYQLGTNIPIFSGRNGIIRYFVNDIEEERQTGYAWYGNWPSSLLDQVKSSGYLDELKVSLPDHQPLTIDVYADPAIVKIHYPNIWPQQRIKEDLTIHVEVFMRNTANLAEMVLFLDGREVYRGSDQEVKVKIPFTELDLGYHKLVVETMTKDGIELSQFINFTVMKRF